MSDSLQQTSVLKYWRAIELFSPQSIPAVEPNDRAFPSFDITQDDTTLPWEPEHRLRGRKLGYNKVWRYRLFVSVYPLDTVRAILETACGKDPEAVDERADGETAMFSISVADDGRPLFDTLVLSNCAWALGRTVTIGTQAKDWLEGASRFQSSFEQYTRKQLGILSDDPARGTFGEREVEIGRSLSAPDLFELANWVTASLGLQSIITAPTVIRAQSYQLAKWKSHEADDADFLNSFFVDDLDRVAEALKAGDSGMALRDYLTTGESEKRIRRTDVRQSLDDVFEALSPDRFPAGRWPAEGHHPLVYSQQFAVNSIWKSLTPKGGLFGVNGPPGTGKTTMLRDIVAAVVVARAKALANLSSPSEGFGARTGWKSGKWNRSISIPASTWTGFEIVAASSNNGAVENITLEIPGAKAIDASWHDQVDYFTRFGTQAIQQPAWGLLAAKLGNKTNRGEFLSNFWHGQELPFEAAIPPENDIKVKKTGFQAWLSAVVATPVDWSSAVKEFEQTLAQEKAERSKLSQVYRRIKALRGERAEIVRIDNESVALMDSLPSYGRRHQAALSAATAQATQTEGQRIAYKRHQENRPGLWEILRSLGRTYREWRAMEHGLRKVVFDSEDRLRQAQNEAAATKQEEIEARKQLQSLAQERKDREAAAGRLSAELQQDRRALEHSFPDDEAWASDEEARELSAPWATKAWNHARAKVFLAALNLHKAFITANADTIRKNLHGLADILDGSAPQTAPKEATLAAWQTLFLVVPVVSSTFASFSRLFSHLGKENIGWLLIDEAGQAVPQAAAGAIWRSRRVVVVGDPLQLEPVVSIPYTAQHALRMHYGTSETWLPGNTSAQKLADRATPFGTTVAQADEHLWVGSPLRVHRRCDREMFDVANKIAYDGLMVFGTQQRKESCLPPTSWHDVVSHEAEKHWIPSEGEAVLSLVHSIRRSGHEADIFLISPFRTVVDGLRRLARQHTLDGIKVGTIHTVQGKEADVVVLVLGGNPKRPGAKTWAAEKPNLLNVAATRAKRRLYVVGNKSEWAQQKYFNYCATRISTHIGF
ncbi:AAA domain-containing protein [Cupriavidus sp. BIS7]|uniref:AAA domain-containing protein n=1 Tax=Cupriavidus sp. BIS7 TaxID=1217718 RepID=UPI0002E02CB0|nr:AAA domain-containing protein [Cupriavidus sp. BIS7]